MNIAQLDHQRNVLWLRSKAEEQLAEGSLGSADEILHELQVHQIELEMQNEQLRQTQIALEESRDRYVNLYEFAPVGYLTINNDGMIDEINLRAAMILGVDRKELIHRSFSRFVADHDRDRWYRLFNSVRKNEPYKEQNVDLTLQHSSGSKFNFQFNCVRINTVYEPMFLRVTPDDITERKVVEQDQRIAAIAFETQEGMLVTDASSRILKVNQAFTRITGYSAAEAIGNNPSFLSAGRHDAKFYEAMWDSINTEDTWDGEVWNKRKNGEVYPEHLTITVVRDEDGMITNYVGALTDSTQHQQDIDKLRSTAVELEFANVRIEEERARLAEHVLERTAQLQNANLAKDSFLATMSHEIRTPLGGLLGMMEMLEHSHLDDKQREMLEAARRSGKSLLRIVNDILDWSKIEAGKLELAPRPASIAALIEEVGKNYMSVASAKAISLSWHCDNTLGAAHLCDALRIEQIINNLISNAIKFTEHGIVEIDAEREAKLDGYETIRFSVKDSGIGISAEGQHHLFENYSQATPETTRLYGGTGLGLAICQRLAQLMNGTLGVESTVGVGTTFSFTISLPVIVVQPEKVQISGDTAVRTDDALKISPIGSTKQHFSILIVDDHPINRMLLKLQLQLLGIDVVEAESGEAGFKLWQDGQFDIIITDCHMPEMDGYELTRHIRDMEKQAAAKPIPIIAWTANVMVEEIEHCHAAGMDGLLTKPTELDVLRAKMVKWLVKSGALPA